MTLGIIVNYFVNWLIIAGFGSGNADSQRDPADRPSNRSAPQELLPNFSKPFKWLKQLLTTGYNMAIQRTSNNKPVISNTPSEEQDSERICVTDVPLEPEKTTYREPNPTPYTIGLEIQNGVGQSNDYSQIMAGNKPLTGQDTSQIDYSKFGYSFVGLVVSLRTGSFYNGDSLPMSSMIGSEYSREYSARGRLLSSDGLTPRGSVGKPIANQVLAFVGRSDLGGGARAY